VRAIWVIGLLLASCLVRAVYAETPPPTGPAGYLLAGETVFVDDELTQIFVTMDPGDLLEILDDPQSDVYYPGTVRVVNSRIDETIGDVGIRLRGNTSRNAVKKSWKLKFNEFVSGRRFQGLKSFNLNGHQNDPSVVRGKLAWDVYNGFEVPSPRASAVRLVINDGSLVDDVYIHAEQIDDLFLSAWFGNDDGNLYQCGYKGERADVRYVSPGTAATYEFLGNRTYELEEDSGSNQFQDLADFIAFIEFADDATFAAEIVERFSVDNFLRSMAVDCVNGHWDNLWYGANNFFLYANPDSGVFEYIPYDLDNTYGTDFFSTNWATRPAVSFGNNGFGWDFGSPFGGGAMPPLVRRIFAIEAYRDQYFRYVRELVGAVGVPAVPVQTAFPDSVGDVFHAAEEPHFDLVSVGLSNDQTDLLIEVRVAGPIDVGGSTDEARILFFFDTRSGGNPGNPWGRQINTGRNSDFFLGSWTDNGGGFILYEWGGGGGWQLRHASFDNTGSVSQDLSDSQAGIVRYRVPMDRLGLSPSSSIAFDVVTTNDRGQSFEPGLDHLSNPQTATPDYATASQAGLFRTHTLTPFEPGLTETRDGLFTLGPREDHIDSLRAQLAPYAYTGPLANGASDYGFTNQDFLDSFTLPAAYSGGQPWAWGVKPYIEARTEYLRLNTPAPADLPRVFVNEVLASNLSVVQDEFGEWDDFVELYNDEDHAVDLSGMYLSDHPGQPRMWRIPDGTVIGSKSFLLVWADDQPEQGPLHATFRLGAGGETVSLSHRDDQGGVLIDALTYPGLGADESYGHYPEASGLLRSFCVVTPSGANDPETDCSIKTNPTPRVYINEWLASNDGVVLDEFGGADDFLELYNDEDVPVDLGGRHLTDNLSNPTKWRIPDGVTIAPKGYLVFWADNEPGQGPLHIPWALSAGGESIGLFDRADNDLAAIDTLDFGAQTTDVSEGRGPDGSACRLFFAPTPGAANPEGPADVAAPIGVLNFFDLATFLGWYNAGDPRADLALPAGVFNFFDISTYIGRFNLPCP
jgi:hypothetical protein